jgi:hypothetical protein
MVVSARRLLQYFSFPDKNSRDISRYIYNVFFAVLQNGYVFVSLFLLQALTLLFVTLRFAEMCLRNIDLEHTIIKNEWNYNSTASYASIMCKGTL